MKVTIDTRHDSLEEALATVQAAFGSSPIQPAPVAVATEPATVPAATPQVTKRARTRKGAAARPGTKTPPHRKEVSCHAAPRRRLSLTAGLGRQGTLGRRRRPRRRRRLATEPMPRVR